MEKKDRLESNLAYKHLVEAFRATRKVKKIPQIAIDTLAGSGHGKVNQFERLKYSPTLFTFVSWCNEAGIDINIKAGTRSVRLKARKALEAERKRKADAGYILDQLVKERKTKHKS